MTAPARVNINQPGHIETFCQSRPQGGFTLGQGYNLINLSQTESRRLIAAMREGLHADHVRYSTSTPERKTDDRPR